MKTLAKLFLIAIGSALIFTGCATPPPTAWEYRTLATDNPQDKSVLESAGKAGWELVSCTTVAKNKSKNGFEYQYVFKRPRQP